MKKSNSVTQKKMSLLTLTILSILCFNNKAYTASTKKQPLNRWSVELVSLKPDQVLSKLDLNKEGLQTVKKAAEKNNQTAAFRELLKYYRAKYPFEPITDIDKSKIKTADDICNRIFQWGPYEPAQYDKDINWQWDPRGDIEWVAVMYRFYWARYLSNAYAATKNEKYAKAFVEMTTDWIEKHPLQKRDIKHYVYGYWRGFPWLDIQTGIRATNLSETFKKFVHSEAFTPQFLAVFLASMHDHQVKTYTLPKGWGHNKAIMEQKGLFSIAATFPEFKETRQWAMASINETLMTFFAQTTADGVQREWSGGYHTIVMRDVTQIMQMAKSLGIDVPVLFYDRLKKMYDYIYAIATPELDLPMFGDCSRKIVIDTNDRTKFRLYKTLTNATQIFGDPKYVALANLDRDKILTSPSCSFPEAGMYVFRSDFGPQQIYMPLHCSPIAKSSHNQPDNGTFELYAFGRWLMPDTGYYTYGHDKKARNWHRQTVVHQTLTVDKKDIADAATHRMWDVGLYYAALVVENLSYPDLLHRRSVWFVDNRFFVFLDEAIGNINGTLRLHFQLAPGDVHFDNKNNSANTLFNDTNVLIATNPASPVTIEEEKGYYAWAYGKRLPRKAFCFKHQNNAPVSFLTVIVPYKGKKTPEVSIKLENDYKIGNNKVNFEVTVSGQTWQIERDILKAAASCKTK